MEFFQEPRNLFIGLMLLFPAIAIGNSLFFGSKLKQFARRIRIFSSYDDIVLFQRVVSQQMYAALVQMVLLVIPAILFVVGVLRGYLDISALVYVVVPSLVILACGIAFKKVEQQVRSIPARDEDLERQRDAIVTTWIRRALPDW